jgi:hypothetical protein
VILLTYLVSEINYLEIMAKASPEKKCFPAEMEMGSEVVKS